MEVHFSYQPNHKQYKSPAITNLFSGTNAMLVKTPAPTVLDRFQAGGYPHKNLTSCRATCYTGAQVFYSFGAGDGTRYKRSPYKILDFDLVGA